ncbi:hypothetical protein GCM10020367_25240 [Streptomyces sannanensis]|uniref:MFS transporter n=1 Tax=Streptomyces sannanensis TaxID=285536 RepID=A0ABP6SB31_9ACTN
MVAALTDGTLPLAVTMAIGGLDAGVLNPILTTVVHEHVPEELRSRVSGVTTAGCEPAMPLGGLDAGLPADRAGLTAALLTLGGVYLLTRLSSLVFPSWRAMDVSGAGPGRPSGATRKRTPHPSAS